MPVWLIRVLPYLRRVPWPLVWKASRWLFAQGRAWLDRNLPEQERAELLRLAKKSKGRRTNLTAREQERFRELVANAFSRRA